MMRPLLVVAGCLAIALGAVGVVLPLVPTTPFLLLAEFCFARSSERLERYLLEHRVFGAYIRNYREGAMTPRDKVRTLALMWVGIGCSAALVNRPLTRVLLPCSAAAVSVHILLLHPAKHEVEE